MIDTIEIPWVAMATAGVTSPILEDIADALGYDYEVFSNATFKASATTSYAIASFGAIKIPDTDYYFTITRFNSNYIAISLCTKDGNTFTHFCSPCVRNFGNVANIYTTAAVIKIHKKGEEWFMTTDGTYSGTDYYILWGRILLDNDEYAYYIPHTDINGYIPGFKALYSTAYGKHLPCAFNETSILNQLIRMPIMLLKNGEVRCAKNVGFSFCVPSGYTGFTEYYVNEVQTNDRFLCFPLLGRYGAGATSNAVPPYICMKEDD